MFVYMCVRMRVRLLLAEVARKVLHAINKHIHPCRGDPVSIDAGYLQFCPQIKFAYGFFQQFRRHARINKRADEHVAADSRETIQIRNLHERPFAQRRRSTVNELFILCFLTPSVKPAVTGLLCYNSLFNQ